MALVRLFLSTKGLNKNSILNKRKQSSNNAEWKFCKLRGLLQNLQFRSCCHRKHSRQLQDLFVMNNKRHCIQILRSGRSLRNHFTDTVIIILLHMRGHNNRNYLHLNIFSINDITSVQVSDVGSRFFFLLACSYSKT